MKSDILLIEYMKKEYAILKKLIEKSNNILLLSHKGPDFDAFASCLILKNFINTFYPKKNVVFKSRQSPTQKLPFMDQITISQGLNTENEDLVIIMDAGGWDICVQKEDTIQLTSAKIAVVDHHQTKGLNADVVINDKMSSTTEQILDFCMSIKGKQYVITPDISTLGQIGIVYDTGRFAYDNTTPQTYELMAKLRRVYPLDLEEFEYKSSKFPQETLLPIKVYIQNIQIVGDMAYTYINKSDINNLKLSKIGINAAQRFVRDSIIRYIQGVHWGFIVKPSFRIENEWIVSLRSSKGYQDVAIIAEGLNGGGHQDASASKVTANDGDQAVKIVLDSIEKLSKGVTSSSQNTPSPTQQPST